MQKIKLIITLLWVGLVLFVVLLGIVLTTLEPRGIINFSLFYLSMLGSAFTAFTLIGFYLRRKFGIREWASSYLILSARQGLWLAILLVLSLLLLSQKLFSWINAIFLVLALVFLESYLLTSKK